jgi:hypothetical protein
VGIKLLKYGIKFSFTILTIIIFVKDGPLFLNKSKKNKSKNNKEYLLRSELKYKILS